jgi:hypothetical protein
MIMIDCLCGCEKKLEPFDKYGRPHKYILGHHAKGSNNYRWKGGRSTSIYGYTIVKKYDHHFAMDGYVFEHRLVWEQFHKASLLPWADCHHINGDKKDNRIENLEAMMHGQHTIITQTVDKSNRVCIDCNLKNVKWGKQYQQGWACHKCYMKRYHRGLS